MPASANERRKAIGKHMQALRKQAGYRSAKAFADKIGINANTYTQYEQGMSGMSYETAWQIANELDCTLDALGGRTPPVHDYDDPRQQALNHCYGMLDDRSKGELAGLATTMTADASRLAVKSGQDPEDVGLTEAV